MCVCVCVGAVLSLNLHLHIKKVPKRVDKQVLLLLMFMLKHKGKESGVSIL